MTHDSDDSDGSDWFDKDENEILEDLIQNKEKSATMNTEFIQGAEPMPGASAYAAYYENPNLDIDETSAAGKPVNPKISIAELRRIAQLQPLDAFLSAATYEPDFNAALVTARDGQDRVLFYVRILAGICSLELPGFHADYLRTFAQNDAFAEHVRYLVERLFCQRYKSLWTDGENVDQIVGDIETLLLQSHQAALLSPKWLSVLREVKRRVVESDAPAVAERKQCLQFRRTLEYMLAAADCVDAKDEEQVELAEKTGSKEKDTQTQLLSPDEFYPTLAEFQAAIKHDKSPDNPKLVAYESVFDYIAAQKRLLREDFMIPLRAYVHSLNVNAKHGTQPLGLFMDDVKIVLNKKFLTVQNHEMVFVDLLGGRRRQLSTLEETEGNDHETAVEKEVQRQLRHIKTGTLLCFTTSCDFENLILATVAFTDEACLSACYLSIEIVRQYNIGNFYGQKLVMFETPAFFEPYQNVYNFLSTCSIANFPMKQYIVSGETKIAPPSYLKANADYKMTKGSKSILFKPQPASSLPPDLYQLNDSQRTAFSNALTQEFCLIQGPPGTGKTHLSVHLMKTLIENAAPAQKPLVLITYTNESLDKCLLKLTAHTNSITRFGNNSRCGELDAYNIREAIGTEPINPRLKRLHYVTNLAYKALFEQMQRSLKDFDGTDESYQTILAVEPAMRVAVRKLHTIRLLFQYYVAREMEVIAMTTTCAAKNNFLFRLLKSPIVVFEEAAEILESHVVACLTPHTQHVIMIGDHRQLKPYTATDHMCMSLFERLIKGELEPSILDVQYRMHPAISRLLCPLIYKTLHDAVGVVDKYPAVRTMRKNLYFLKHSETESKAVHESSIYNVFEIEEIRKLAQHLILEAQYLPSDLVILSPYAKQIELIRKELKRHAELQSIRVSTVDSFQGLESNIVLLTLVRSNREGQLGFLKKMNRICVALSRAKHALYMIGNMELFAKCDTWNSVFKTLRAQGAIGSKFPYENQAEEEEVDETKIENETADKADSNGEEKDGGEDDLNWNADEMLCNLLKRNLSIDKDEDEN